MRESGSPGRLVLLNRAQNRESARCLYTIGKMSKFLRLKKPLDKPGNMCYNKVTKEMRNPVSAEAKGTEGPEGFLKKRKKV